MGIKQNWRYGVILAILFILALLPRIFDLNTFWAADERFHWELSNSFFMALLQGDWAGTRLLAYDGITLYWINALGNILKFSLTWLSSSGPISIEDVLAIDCPYALLGQHRLPLVVAHALMIVGIFVLAGPVLGRKAAWMGVTLIVLSPFLLAESRVSRPEALVAGLMTLSVLTAIYYLKARRTFLLVMSAVLTALAILAKVSAVILLPIVALLGVVIVWKGPRSPANSRPIRKSASTWILKYLLWVGIVVLCCYVLWPALWFTPRQVFLTMMEYVGGAIVEGFDGRGTFFWGEIHRDNPGFWFYAVALLFRLSPFTVVGAIIAIAVLILKFWQRKTALEEIDWQWWGTLLLLIYVILFIVIMSLGKQKYDRYLLPIFPALDLVAGVGWFYLGQWLIRHWFKSSRSEFVLGAGWIVLFISQLLITIPHHPYYYTYYNPLLGGIRQAVHYVRVGYSEGLEQVPAYLESKPNVSQLKLASGNSSKLRGLYSGPTIPLDNLDGKWVQGDYVLLYISQLQRGKHSEDILAYIRRQEPEYILKLHGVEYAWLYPGPSAQYYGGGHKLEGRGTFFGYDLSATALTAGDVLTTTLYWRNEGQLEDDRFFVRLMDLDGYVWAEAIAQPRPGFEQANRQENAIVESEAVLTLPVGMPPSDYFFKPGFRTANGEIIGYFELPGDTKPLAVENLVSPGPVAVKPDHPVAWRVTNDLRLVGYDFTPFSSPDSAAWLTLYWHAIEDIANDYVILIRLLDSAGQEVVYWLGRPVRSGYPTPVWRAHQIVQDPWLLTVEDGPGTYVLEIAIFDAESEAEVSRKILGEVSIE